MKSKSNNTSISNDNPQQKHQRKYSVKSENRPYRGKESYPEITQQVLDEAIKLEILPSSFKDKLITNPNKYSLFFTEFDVNSPTMKQSLKNLNLNEQDAKTLSYQEFSSQTFNTLNNVISYLYYLTEHYEKLKALVNERKRLKRDQILFKRLQSENNLFYTPRGLVTENESNCEDKVIEFIQSPHFNKMKFSPIRQKSNSKLNRSMSQLIEKSKNLKSFEVRKSISTKRYEKYDEVLNFVRQDKISNLQEQKKYEDINIKNHEKKLEDRQSRIKKELEMKSKGFREKLKRAQQKVRQCLERQEQIFEKKIVDIDATGEKYEEYKIKRQETQLSELLKLREIKQQKADQIQKNREQRIKDETQKRQHLNYLIEQRENNAENIMRRIKSEHDRKFQNYNIKYDEKISNFYNQQENCGNQNIQKICENEVKRIHKTEEKEKALQNHIKSKQEDYSKKLERIQKYNDNISIKNENKLEKLKEKLHNKFIRIDKVNDMTNQKAKTLIINNNQRQNRVQSNFAQEIYQFAIKQDSIIQKHMDINQKNRNNSFSSQDYFDHNRSLSEDLFIKRDDQYNKLR